MPSGPVQRSGGAARAAWRPFQAPRGLAPLLALGLALSLGAPALHAGELDAQGRYQFSAEAPVRLGFEDEADWSQASCDDCTLRLTAEEAELALEGRQWLTRADGEGALELTLLSSLPAGSRAGYRASAWVRHGRVTARLTATAGETEDSVPLFPTGRVTSDGWVELESGVLHLEADELTHLTLTLSGRAIELDAVELRRVQSYQAPRACLGAFDARCDASEVCLAERCRSVASLVPPLPPAGERDQVAAYLASRLEYFFGGRLTRLNYLPLALAELEHMLTATDAASFFSAFERGVRQLHDAHTVMLTPARQLQSERRLGVCFIEGRADLSRSTWPSTVGYADVLVSHVGEEAHLGLRPGDRLVAIDGQHPIAWSRQLIAVNARFRVATGPGVYAEHTEQLHQLIPLFARSFSVLRCDPVGLTCADQVETLPITALPHTRAELPACDNRPKYHQDEPPPGAALHRLDAPWHALVSEAASSERIHGVTWNDLMPDAAQFFRSANDVFRTEARGVILDHRTGNGGVLIAPQAVTELVRTPELLSIGSFMNVAGDDGPESRSAGQAWYQQLLAWGGAALAYQVGSEHPALDLPVALLLHRDTSASDWLPHGMKGAPKVRIFGPHETSGAFSSYYQFDAWGYGFTLASGDTVTREGELLIGHGVSPDELVEHTQTSLLSGVDAPYARALEWVRSELR